MKIMQEMARGDANIFQSLDGVNLREGPVFYVLEIDGVSRFSVCIDIKGGSSTSSNQALIRLDFSDDSVEMAELGLVESHHGWWYRYLNTSSGVTESSFDFILKRGFKGFVRVGIYPWSGDDELNVMAVALIACPPVEKLVVCYASVRDDGRYSTKYWNSISEFLSAPGVAGGAHAIPINDLLLDFCLVRRSNSSLLCHLHGNAPRSDEYKLPAFSGWNVTKGIESSLLIFSDPALLRDPQLELSWHLGTESTSTQYMYELIVRKVVSVLSPERLIFWGGSGGGFGAMYLSAKFSGSTAFVWNPQTSIFDYEQSAVAAFGQACFGSRDSSEVKNRLKNFAVFDLADLYREPKNEVVYFQNITDWHTNSHLRPFLEKIGIQSDLSEPYCGWLGENFFLQLGDLAEGHQPPPKEVIASVLTELCERGTSGLDGLKRVTPSA